MLITTLKKVPFAEWNNKLKKPSAKQNKRKIHLYINTNSEKICSYCLAHSVSCIDLVLVSRNSYFVNTGMSLKYKNSKFVM